MSNEDSMTDHNEWTDCPAGTLRAYSKQQDGQSLRRTTSILASAGLVALLALGIVAMQPGAETSPTTPAETRQLSCVQTFRMMTAYFADELSEEEVGLVHDHLKDCPHCKRKYQMQADSLGKELLVSSSRTTYRFSVTIASLAPSLFSR